MDAGGRATPGAVAEEVRSDYARAAVRHDYGPFDQYRMLNHRLDELPVAQGVIVQSQCFIDRFLSAHQIPWLHVQQVQDLF